MVKPQITTTPTHTWSIDYVQVTYCNFELKRGRGRGEFRHFLETKSKMENSRFYHVRLFPLFLLEQHCEALPLLVVESLDVHQRLALEAQLQACETISVEKIRRDVTLDSSNKVFKGG